MDSIDAALAEVATSVTNALDRLLPAPLGAEAKVMEAMRYACLGGGKRIRPFLVVAGSRLFDVNEESAHRVAAAIEMVHCYSLVHDDLPAMDDSDLRRGRPTVHKKFDEATAILAGDGLLTLAFEVVGAAPTHDNPAVRAELVIALAKAAGVAGMVGGQMIDLEGENARLDLGAITRLQRMKTGALIAFSCSAGAVLGQASEPARHALVNYAHDLGLAFQIADDLLDYEGTEAATGKPVGADQEAGKATFVALLGIERAREQAQLLARQAAGHLDLFGEKADLLRQMSYFVVNRKH
ncbi:MAG: polyprenyl synthetase family protein [Dongiaceae bacterium]